ncbi:MAG: hypothetical protein K5681_08085 [Treponema sp.]|nr:hypothetical protein [Treponema sp.]
MKKTITILLALFFTLSLNAQEANITKGQWIDEQTGLHYFNYETTVEDFTATKYENYSLSVSGIPTENCKLDAIYIRDGNSKDWRTYCGRWDIFIPEEKGKSFEYTVTAEVFDYAAKISPILRFSVIVEPDIEAFDIENIKLTCTKTNDAAFGTWIGDDGNRYFGKNTTEKGILAKKGDTIKITMSGIPDANVTLDGIVVHDEMSKVWHNFASSPHWPDGTKFQKGQAFEKVFYLYVDNDILKTSFTSLRSQFKAEDTNESLTIKDYNIKWEKSDVAAFWKWVHDQDGKLRFENRKPVDRFEFHKGDTLEYTISGIPSANATIDAVNVIDGNMEEWYDFGGANGESFAIEKGKPFERTYFIRVWQEPKKNYIPSLRAIFMDAEDLIIEDYKVSCEKTTKTAFNHYEHEGRDYFDYYYNTGKIKSKKNDYVEVTVEGVANQDAILTSLSLWDDSDPDWQKHKPIGGDWRLYNQVKAGEVFHKTARFKLEEMPDKKISYDIQITFTKPDTDTFIVDKLKASWRPAPDVPKEISRPIFSDEWGKRFEIDFPLKNTELKKGQKVQLTFSGKANMDCFIAGWLANTETWESLSGEPEFDNPEYDGVKKDQPFTISGRLPVTANTSKKDNIIFHFWIPWEEGMPEELNMTDIEFTWKVLK